MKNIIFSPIIKAYPEYAHLFSILGPLENNDYYIKWFCGNYIQLRFDSHKDVDEALFFEKDAEECNIYRCSLLDKMVFEKQMFQTKEIFWEMLKHYLEAGYYILVVLDHFYMPADKTHFQKEHLNHECLIYGMDFKKHTYYVQDFFDSIYTDCEIKEEYLWESYLNHYDYEIFDDEKIYLFKKKTLEELSKLPFQSLKIRSQFENYLKGEKSLIDGRIYGIFCYDELIEKIDIARIDSRNFHLLYEHALANSIRLKYLVQWNLIPKIDDLQLDFDMLCKNALSARNKLLKWSFRREFYPEQLKDFLFDQRNLEIQSITKLLNNWNL